MRVIIINLGDIQIALHENRPQMKINLLFSMILFRIHLFATNVHIILYRIGKGKGVIVSILCVISNVLFEISLKLHPFTNIIYN